MNELCSTILEKHQIRKGKHKKNAFITLMQEAFPHICVQESPVIKSRNLILGDVASAKAVLTAHYDTCAVMPVPNFITPMNPLLAIGYSILILIPMIVLLVGLNVVMEFITASFWVHYAVSLGVWIGFMALLMAGPSNRHTANDNTSGVITLLKIYEAMSKQQRAEIAFVFFDNEELGLLGSSYFYKMYKKDMKDKLLINFDCVSDGDHFLVASSKKARKKYAQLMEACYQDTDRKKAIHKALEHVYYPSDQASFPLAIAVAALNRKKFVGYYMDKIHTKHDTVFMEENIDYLRDHTLELLDRI